jgi:hypothetical protein
LGLALALALVLAAVAGALGPRPAAGLQLADGGCSCSTLLPLWSAWGIGCGQLPVRQMAAAVLERAHSAGARWRWWASSSPRCTTTADQVVIYEGDKPSGLAEPAPIGCCGSSAAGRAPARSSRQRQLCWW